MESKVDYKWFVTIILLGFCIYLQYSTMKKIPNVQMTDSLFQALIDNKAKMDSIQENIDSLNRAQSIIEKQINENYNDYVTNINNSYYSTDSIKFRNLSDDLDSMDNLWRKGYYIKY